MNRQQRRRQAKNDREIERHRAEIRFALQELVAAGYVVATGEMRPGRRTGVLEPVYVLRKYAAEMGLPLPPLKPLLFPGDHSKKN
jgi:hypothetical protein